MPKVAAPAVEHGFPSHQRASSAAPSTPRRRTPARSRYSSATPGRSSAPSNVPASPSSSKKEAVSPFPPVSAAEEHLWDVLYTDGACSNNGKGASALAGIGVWSAEDESRRTSERCPGEQTNNRAELIALIRALETTPFGGKQLLLKTDSKYAIKCVYQWMRNWAQNGWKTAAGQPVKNQPLIRYLAALLQLREMRGKVRLQHVRGHSGEPGNDASDALARAGALLPACADEDWDAKLQDVQDQIDGELLAMADVHSPKKATVVLSPRKTRVMSPSKCKETMDVVEEEEDDDEFPDSAGEWMEDIDEAELAKLDSSPAKQHTSAPAKSAAVDDDEFDDADDPFADLTAEQLDELEGRQPHA